MCLMGRKQQSRETEKKNEKPTINLQKSRQRTRMHFLVRDSTWAGPWAGPSNPRAGPRNCRVGQYRARVSWTSLPCDWPGRAETFAQMMGRAGPTPAVRL